MALGTGNGLWGQYYDNVDFTNFKMGRTDTTVNFAVAQPGSLDPSVGASTYSIVWQGFVEPQCSGTFNFRTLSDDGVRLYVHNGTLVINDWNQHGSTTDTSGNIAMTTGVQVKPIRMEYYQNYGDMQAMGSGVEDRLFRHLCGDPSSWRSTPPPVQTPTPTATPTAIPTICPQSDNFNAGALSGFWNTLDINCNAAGSQTDTTTLQVTGGGNGITYGSIYGDPTTDDGFRLHFPSRWAVTSTSA